MVHRYGGRARYYSDSCEVVCVDLGVNSCCTIVIHRSLLTSLIGSGEGTA